MNDQDVYDDLQRIILEQLQEIRSSPYSSNIVLGFNVYNDAQRLKNNRFHQDREEFWTKLVKTFKVDSIVEGEDKFMINQISGKKDFKELEEEGTAQKQAMRMKYLMSVFRMG